MTLLGQLNLTISKQKHATIVLIGRRFPYFYMNCNLAFYGPNQVLKRLSDIREVKDLILVNIGYMIKMNMNYHYEIYLYLVSKTIFFGFVIISLTSYLSSYNSGCLDITVTVNAFREEAKDMLTK